MMAPWYIWMLLGFASGSLFGMVVLARLGERAAYNAGRCDGMDHLAGLILEDWREDPPKRDWKDAHYAEPVLWRELEKEGKPILETYLGGDDADSL